VSETYPGIDRPLPMPSPPLPAEVVRANAPPKVSLLGLAKRATFGVVIAAFMGAVGLMTIGWTAGPWVLAWLLAPIMK